jgi:hypothetical protein
MAETMKKAVFWDVAPCSSFVNRRSIQVSGSNLRVTPTVLTEISRGIPRSYRQS